MVKELLLMMKNLFQELYMVALDNDASCVEVKFIQFCYNHVVQ